LSSAGFIPTQNHAERLFKVDAIFSMQISGVEGRETVFKESELYPEPILEMPIVRQAGSTCASIHPAAIAIPFVQQLASLSRFRCLSRAT
jgi:hypothetical protein